MSFERLMAFHCAPALAGIKPANLFTWHRKKEGDERDTRTRIRDYEKKLKPYGIDIDTLCECAKYVLVFIYRKEMVEAHLSLPEAKRILVENGYQAELPLVSKLEILKSRLVQQVGFPHEIGLFLGYPTEDVAGFITHQGAQCKLCGNWKVYGDAEKARLTFQKYEQCRDIFCSKLSMGNDITEIIENIKISA